MAYISTAEVAAIRGQLKEKFPQLKFGVRKHHHSSVDVTIKSGTIDFSDILDSNGYAQINQYWLDRTGEHKKLFEGILKVIKTAPGTVKGGREWFDESDAMTDYFHTAFYMSVNVGAWNKPYVLAKAPKKPVQRSKSIKVPKKARVNDAGETVARMNKEEQDNFVDYIVTRYPNLADDLMTKIGFSLMDKEENKCR